MVRGSGIANLNAGPRLVVDYPSYMQTRSGFNGERSLGVGTTPWRRAPLNLIIVIGGVLLMWTAVATASWAAWGPGVFGVATALVAVALLKMSFIAAAYLFQSAIYFGLAPVLAGGDVPPLATTVPLVWYLGVGVGAALAWANRVNRDFTPTTAIVEFPGRYIVIGAGFLVVQLALLQTGQFGYSAQIRSGVSTPVGVLGSLAAIAPAYNLAMLYASVKLNSRMKVAVAVATAQLLILAFTGFRGASIGFALAALFGSIVCLPRESSLRRPTRAFAGAILTSVVAIVGFMTASRVKSQAAQQLDVVSSGTELWNADTWLPSLASRLDLTAPLEVALPYRGTRVVELVDWLSQAVAVIPRVIWPEKPITDYGQVITSVIYNSSGYSSSTITTVGDVYLNTGFIGLAFVGVGVGFAICHVETFVRSRSAVWPVVLLAALVTTTLDHEAPLALGAIDMLRTVIVVGGLWTLLSVRSGGRLDQSSVVGVDLSEPDVSKHWAK